MVPFPNVGSTNMWVELAHRKNLPADAFCGHRMPTNNQPLLIVIRGTGHSHVEHFVEVRLDHMMGDRFLYLVASVSCLPKSHLHF